MRTTALSTVTTQSLQRCSGQTSARLQIPRAHPQALRQMLSIHSRLSQERSCTTELPRLTTPITSHRGHLTRSTFRKTLRLVSLHTTCLLPQGLKATPLRGSLTSTTLIRHFLIEKTQTLLALGFIDACTIREPMLLLQKHLQRNTLTLTLITTLLAITTQ